MAKQIVLTLAKVKGSSNSADIVDQISVNSGNGSPVHVRAVDNVYYQLTDLSTQYGPENIMTQRVGNDLYIAFEGESIDNPSLIIDGYYSLNPNGSKNLLVGQHENGSFYPYIPESAQQTDAVHMLADHVAAGQALGGDSHFAGIIPVAAGGSISPWAILGGLAAIGGLAALISHNNKDNSHKNSGIEPAPQPPRPYPPGPDNGGDNPLNPTNVKPVANADSAQGTKGNPVTVSVLANDTDPQGNNTLDAGSVRILNSNGQGVKTLTVAGEGTWTVNADGSITFTPAAGFTGNPTPIRYTVSDTDGNVSDPASVTVSYSGGTPPTPNVNPVANADSAQGSSGNPVTVNVLENDTDPQGNNTLDPTSVRLLDTNGLPVTSLTVAGEGTWTVNPNGSITFTPVAGFTGNPTPVKYTVADVDGNVSTPASVTVTYGTAPTPLNPPSVERDGAHQGGIIIKPAADADRLDIRYTDENDQTRTLTVHKDPASGQWSGSGLPADVSVDPATGTVTLAPDAVKDGSTVSAHNSRGSDTSADASATADNDADSPNPLAFNDTVSDVPLGQAAEVDVLANDSDPQGRDTLDKGSVKLLDANGQGVTTLTVAGEGTWTVDTTSGKITFTPDAGFVGNPTPVKYTVADVNGNVSEPATVTINYAASPSEIPDRPVLENGTGSEQGGVTVTPGANTDKVEITYTDENDQTRIITVTKAPAGKWTAAGVPDDQGVTVDETSGAVKLPPDAVKDSSIVEAIAHNGSNPITTRNQTNAEFDALKAPTVEQDTAHQGGIIVKPAAEADKVTVKYTDEAGQDHTVTVSRNGPGTGGWSGVSLPQGVSVDPATGTVTLAPDAVKDGSTVSANNSRGVETSVDATAQAADNAAAPQVWLEGDSSVNEGSDAAYTVKLNAPAQEDVKVTIKVIHVSTTDGDISYTVNTVTIPKGQQEASFNITATDDTTPEANESYRVEISEATGATADSARSSVTTEIIDNDPLNAPAVAAGDTQGSVVITPAEGADKVVVRFNDEAQQPHTATVSKNPVTGEWTIDSPLPGVSVDPASGKVTLAPSAVEDGSDVTATNSVGTRDSDPATVKAGDNPSEPEIGISGSAEVKEGETATYTVALNKAAGEDVTVTVTLTHKGTDDADFTQAPVSKTITIPAGQTSAQFTLDIARDGKFEGSEGYSLTLSNPQGAVLGQASVDTKVTDIDPPPAPSVEPGSEQGSVVVTPATGTDKLVVNFNDEAGQPQTVTVNKDPATGEWSGDNLPQGVTVNPQTGIVTIGATAVADGSDVKAVASAGNTDSAEGTGKAGNNGTTPGEPTLTISGDSEVEEGAAATYTIRLSEARTDDTTVTVTLTHKETGDADFDASAQPLVKTLTIPAGQTEVKLTLNTVDDSEAEGKESFTIGLSNPSSGVKLGAVSEVTTTINDNDTAPNAEVKSVSSPSAEEGQPLVFDVAVDKPAADTEISLTLKGGTATLGTDTGKVEVSTDGGTTWAAVTPDSDGNFTATVPKDSENGVKVRVQTVLDTDVAEGSETLILDAAAAGQTGTISGTGTISDVVAPQAPNVAAGSEQGSVTVTPPAGADKLTVTYKDEDKTEHEVVVSKDPASGEWQGTNLPEGITVDAKTGVVTLAAKAVLDNSEVKAVAANGVLSSEAGSATAGADAVNSITGEATTNAIAADKVGLSGEYYGYNDDGIDKEVANNPKVAANVRYHADDKTSPSDQNTKHNLYDLDFTETMINNRNGAASDSGKKVTGSIRSVDEGTPDVRFTVTDINYGGKAAVSSGLANNEKTAVGQGLSAGSALRNFLDVNGAADADSARVEAGAPYNGTSGLGYTTDAAVRIVGHVYFGEGTYDFKFALDNGATVRIDGQDIYKGYSISEVNTLGGHPNGIHLSEGVHSVEIIYIEEGSVSTLQMQYKAHGAADSDYKVFGLDNNLMLKPEADLDLNQLQDVVNTGTANNPAWHVRTGATLDGGEGKDDITGSDGRDFIYGHDGNDSLTGGKGADTFIYNTKAANGHDVIKDFKIGEDKISLTDLLEAKSIDAKTPGWQGQSAIQNAQWDDSAHKLSFDTTDGVKTYHNSITFEGMTQHYSSVDDFLRENGNGII